MSEDDPYAYPGSSVLRNLLELRDADALAAAESRLTALADVELAAEPICGRFDLAHLQAIHRALFADVYEWAGELRTVAIAKADMFCLPQYIESCATDTFKRLARERHLAGLDREQFADRLSVYFGDVNALHPFPRGQRPRATCVLYAARARSRLPARLVRRRCRPQHQRINQRHARRSGASTRPARRDHLSAAEG